MSIRSRFPTRTSGCKTLDLFNQGAFVRIIPGLCACGLPCDVTMVIGPRQERVAALVAENAQLKAAYDRQRKRIATLEEQAHNVRVPDVWVMAWQEVPYQCQQFFILYCTLLNVRRIMGLNQKGASCKDHHSHKGDVAAMLKGTLYNESHEPNVALHRAHHPQIHVEWWLSFCVESSTTSNESHAVVVSPTMQSISCCLYAL